MRESPRGLVREGVGSFVRDSEAVLGHGSPLASFLACLRPRKVFGRGTKVFAADAGLAAATLPLANRVVARV